MSLLLPQALSTRLVSLAAVPHLLVCSDYDGTLAPIAPRPHQAQLLPGAHDLLTGLARLPDTRVAIVSGRARDELRAHSGVDHPVLLVGSHGAEFPGRTPSETQAGVQARLDALEAGMLGICAVSPAAWVERKPFGIAVHVREASAGDAERILAAVRGELTGWPDVQVTEGKAVIELSLSRTRKDDAIRWLREGMDEYTCVIYLGDDVTDETAFAALGPRDVGIKVGEGPTAATYRVASEQAALDVLALLLQHRSAGSAGGLTRSRPPP